MLGVNEKISTKKDRVKGLLIMIMYRIGYQKLYDLNLFIKTEI